MSRSRRSASPQFEGAVIDDDALDRDLDQLRLATDPFGVVIDDEAQERLRTFARTLIVWNERDNLLSRADVHNVIKKHVSASLGVFLLADPIPGQRWLDVGTGAGFPGLVLKLVRPDVSMTLVDSAKKRCAFLEHVSRTMDLKTLQILSLRAERLLSHRGGRRAFDVVTSRAVASLAEAADSFGGLVAPGGRFITFKGPAWASELDGARESLTANHLVLESVTRVPWTQSHIVMLRSTQNF